MIYRFHILARRSSVLLKVMGSSYSMINNHGNGYNPIIPTNTIKCMVPSRLKNLDERGSVSFELLDWNILSQDLLFDHGYLYTQCDRQSLRWETRWQKIRHHLSQPNLSIICLQEVHSYHYFHDLKPFLELLGFRSIYKKRGGDKHDGCAIFYRPNVFHLEAARRIDFNQDIISDQQRRDNVAIIARFRPSNPYNEKKLIVAMTHLLYNPRRGDIKIAQLRILLAEVRRMALRPNARYHPIIMCGDFNCYPHCPIHEFVLKGSINPVGLGKGNLSGQQEDPGRTMMSEDLLMRGIGMNCQFDEKEIPVITIDDNDEKEPETSSTIEPSIPSSTVLSHDFHFRSVHPVKNEETGQNYISTCVSGEGKLVDYIFFMSSGHLACTSYQELPTTESAELQFSNWLPNERVPSDHLPLQASFLLTP